MFSLNNENLLLQKFEIYGLFDMYDYQNIKFKTDDGIMIIYGRNGVGKTTILKLINFIAKLEFSDITNINFKKLSMHFLSVNNQKTIIVDIERSSDNIIELSIKFSEKEKPFHYLFEIDKYISIFKDDTDQQLEDFILFVKEPRKFSKKRGLEKMLDSKIFKTYRSEIFHKETPNKDLVKEIKDFINFRTLLSEIMDHFKCHFIQSQRLDVSFYIKLRSEKEVKEEKSKRSERKKKPPPKIKSVIRHKSTILILKIREKLSEYTKISQAQDKDLVNRIINSIKSSENFSYEEIYNELENLETIQTDYTQAGLDTSEVSEKIDLRSSLEKSLKWQDQWQIQILYRILKKEIIADSWEKIKAFEKLYKKIALFQTIINDHLTNKRLEINHKEGLIIINEINEQQIDLDLLSSGEKNLIILFFELIFETEPYTLIMIDEPEISLHVEWQIRFVKNLLKIRNSGIKELENIRYILATHSPQIIHDRRDLTVELETEE